MPLELLFLLPRALDNLLLGLLDVQYVVFGVLPPLLEDSVADKFCGFLLAVGRLELSAVILFGSDLLRSAFGECVVDVTDRIEDVRAVRVHQVKAQRFEFTGHPLPKNELTIIFTLGGLPPP